MSMNFLDETDDWPEYQTVREEILRLEREHLQLCRDLAAIESATAPGGMAQEMQARADSIRNRLGDVQKKLDESLSLYR